MGLSTPTLTPTPTHSFQPTTDPQASHTHMSLLLLDLGAPQSTHSFGHTRCPRSPRRAHSAFPFSAGVSHLPFTATTSWHGTSAMPGGQPPRECLKKAHSLINTLCLMETGSAVLSPAPHRTHPLELLDTWPHSPGWAPGSKGVALDGVLCSLRFLPKQQAGCRMAAWGGGGDTQTRPSTPSPAALPKPAPHQLAP